MYHGTTPRLIRRTVSQQQVQFINRFRSSLFFMILKLIFLQKKFNLLGNFTAVRGQTLTAISVFHFP